MNLHLVPSAPLLQRVQTATGLADAALAHMLGMPKATVQAYRTGRRVEYLSTAQKTTLEVALRLVAQACEDLADELDLMA